MPDLLKVCVVISLSLWVGALSFFAAAVVPEGSKSPFTGIDRWSSMWGAITVLTLFSLFFPSGRVVEVRSLILEIPIGVMFLLTAHLSCIVHHQMREVTRKMEMLEFQGTTHRRLIKLSLDRLSRRSRQLQWAIVFLGVLSLGATPYSLR